MDRSDQKILYQKNLEALKKYNPKLFAYRNRRFAGVILLLILTEGVVGYVTYACCARYGTTPALYFGIMIGLILPFTLLRVQDCFSRPKIFKLTHDEYFMRVESTHRFNLRGTVTRCYIKFTDEEWKDSITLEQKYEHYYRIGDTVMCVPGLKFPINLTPYDDRVCPKCGTVLHKHNPICVGHCNMPRLKLPEQKGLIR